MLESMNPELRRYVEQKVSLGLYPSEEAVVVHAVRMMKAQDEEVARLREELRRAAEQIDRGAGREWDLDAAERRLDERLGKTRQAG